jgi:hypothetical protein
VLLEVIQALALGQIVRKLFEMAEPVPAFLPIDVSHGVHRFSVPAAVVVRGSIFSSKNEPGAGS